MVKTGATYTPALQLVTFSAMAVILFLVLFLRGDASAGDLVAYISAAGMLPKPIRQLSEVSGTIQKGLAGAESIFAQLDETPERDDGTIERERVSGPSRNPQPQLPLSQAANMPFSMTSTFRSSQARWSPSSAVRAAASRHWSD
jgi:ABC-type multidrug transport system fused ATPase/permease subunit